MKIHSFILGVVLAVTASTGFAQWQWLDKDGRKVFSDRPPPSDIAEKSILKRPSGSAKAPSSMDAKADAPANGADSTAAATSNSRPALSGLDKELEAKKKQAADAEAAKRKAADDAIVKARIESCARAKQAKATLDSGVRMARANAAGEQELMDDAARAEEGRRIQGVINSDCR